MSSQFSLEGGRIPGMSSMADMAILERDKYEAESPLAEVE